MQALQDVHWAFSQPLHSFHPRAYNLSQEADFAHFDIDFKWTAAAAVLRVLLRDGGFHAQRVPGEQEAQLALLVCQTHLAYVRCATALALIIIAHGSSRNIESVSLVNIALFNTLHVTGSQPCCTFQTLCKSIQGSCW